MLSQKRMRARRCSAARAEGYQHCLAEDKRSRAKQDGQQVTHSVVVAQRLRQASIVTWGRLRL